MFAFDLAKELRCPNVDAMLASIPLPMFYEWMDYATRKPFGDERADLRIGMMASALLNIQLAKGQRRTWPIDFMPFSKEHKSRAKQTPDQMAGILKGLVRQHKDQAGRREAKANANRS